MNISEILQDYKESIWEIYFNMTNTIFKQNNYVFDYKISTDGFGVSIQMLNKKYIEWENKKKLNMKNKKTKNKKQQRNWTIKKK